MKIAIDCQIIQNNTGIGTYLKGVLPYFIEMGKEDSFFLFGGEEYLNSFKKDNVEIIKPGYSSIRSTIFKSLFLNTEEINKCDAFFSPFYLLPFKLKIPSFFIIHDTVFFDLPNLLSFYNGFIIKSLMKLSFNKAKVVFTVSEFSKSRIQHYFGNSKKIILASPSISSLIEQKGTEAKKSIEGDYIIFVGSSKRHKGLEILLDAYSECVKRGFNKKIVIVGLNAMDIEKNKYIKDFLQRHSENTKIEYNIVEEVLIEKIRGAYFLVMPSLYEGFGIPPLEALYLGVKSIVSDVSSLKEMYSRFKGPITFFKNGNAQDLADKMMNFKYEEIDLKDQILKEFSFKKTTGILYSEIKNAIDS